MASLANQTISSTYDGLIKTSTDQPVGVSGVQLLEDGVGNSLALSVGRANQGVTVTGTLTATTVTGTLSATSVLADGVIATTQATSDNSTKVATTAFVKSVVTAEDLDIAGDSGTGAVDLDSQTLTISGTANEIETSASGQTITIGLPSTITTNVTGDVSGNLTGNVTGNLTGNVTGNVSGNLTGTVLTAAQANITSVGTLSSLAVSGNLTVDTNTLFVDAANNRVGIGTSSLLYKLTINTSDENHLRLENGSELGFIKVLDSGILNIWSHGDTNNEITFSKGTGAGTESMRIDSSGNVMVGMTTASSSNDGFAAYAAGYVSIADTSFSPLILNRKTTDGTILDLKKDGTTVGKIDVSASGASIYLGGTAAANALDDYEEGTWTPVYQPSTGSFATMTMNTLTAKYTKIGNMVTVYAVIRTSDVDVTGGSGDVRIGGLPFTVSAFGGGISLGLTGNFTNAPDGGHFFNATTQITLRKTNVSTGLVVADLSNGTNVNHNALYFTGTYLI